MSLALRRQRRLLSAGHGLLRLVARWSARLALCSAVAHAPAQVAAPTASPALPPTLDEAKAANLHRFAGFVEWPLTKFASPDAPIVVGTVGSPGVHKELAQIVAGRLVQNRAMQVVELDEPRQSASVHILMIGRGAWKRAGEWIAAVKGQPVLVITDMPQGLERGATLCFIESEGRLRFEASVAAAEAAGLKLSSRLLPLAERVVKPS
jgi:hypothetical protein